MGEIQTKATSRHKLRKVDGPATRGSALSSGVTLELGEGADVQAQLRDALAKNAARVIDLFREWDEDGNGEVSKKEFGKAMRKARRSETRPGTVLAPPLFWNPSARVVPL